MIEVVDFLITGSFKIGAYKIYLNDLSYDELRDIFGTPDKIYSIIGYAGVDLYVFEDMAEGRLLIFTKDSRVIELHLEADQDILIKHIIFATRTKPTMVMNKKIKYLFFSPHFAGRILDESHGTLDILGFFSEKYLKENKLPQLFLSGVIYDPLKLQLIHEE
jgi:hypothetical protein